MKAGWKRWLFREGSEFQTEGAATLKREAKVVWTPGTDNSLMLEERREHARMW